MQAHIRKELAAVHGPYQQAMKAEHERLVENFRASGERCADEERELLVVRGSDGRALAENEAPHTTPDHEQRFRGPAPCRRRYARTLVQPAPVRRAVVLVAPRPTLMRPDFSGLLARISGARSHPRSVISLELSSSAAIGGSISPHSHVRVRLKSLAGTAYLGTSTVTTSGFPLSTADAPAN